MFEHMTHWQWVALAWLELVVAYGGYVLYLGWRARRAARGGDATAPAPDAAGRGTAAGRGGDRR